MAQTIRVSRSARSAISTATYGPLVLGQLKGRALPLAAAKFAEAVARRLNDARTLPTIDAAGQPEDET